MLAFIPLLINSLHIPFAKFIFAIFLVFSLFLRNFATAQINRIMVKKLILLLSLFLFCNLFIYSKDGSGNTNDNPVITLKSTNPSQRPQAPSNQQITCTYTEGCLFFNFRYPEGLCSLEVTDFETGDILTYTFDSEGEAAVLVGELNNAHLLITTAFGHSYEGNLQ